ncbi:MAG: HisA/HisF-related TIM barrel protein [Methanomassiliicoccales archaeon]
MREDDMPRQGLYACPYCGGRTLEPTQLISGPLVTVDNWDGSYRCLECRKVAVPLYFRSAEEWVLFRQERSRRASFEEERRFLHIPIVPVDTRQLLGQTGFDIPLIKVVEVVSVRWGKNGYERTNYAESFERYWRVVSGSRYQSQQIMLMDLAGISQGRPNFKVLRDLVKSKYEIWLDLGIRDIHDVFDAFSLEAYKALVATSVASSIHLFEEVYSISDRCVPLVQINNDVIWGKNGAGPKRLEDALDELKRLGFEEVALMDLSALGTNKGISEELIERAKGFVPQIYYGGGVLESDLECLKRHELAGAFLEPFTPIIKDLIVRDDPETISEAPTGDFTTIRNINKYTAID